MMKMKFGFVEPVVAADGKIHSRIVTMTDNRGLCSIAIEANVVALQ
jgi:hypothetical protein